MLIRSDTSRVAVWHGEGESSELGCVAMIAFPDMRAAGQPQVPRTAQMGPTSVRHQGHVDRVAITVIQDPEDLQGRTRESRCEILESFLESCVSMGASESCLADPRRASHFVCGSVGVSKQNGRCELQRVPRTQLILSRWGRGPGGQVTNWKISGRTECRGANGRGLAGIGREEEQTAH